MRAVKPEVQIVLPIVAWVTCWLSDPGVSSGSGSGRSCSPTTGKGPQGLPAAWGMVHRCWATVGDGDSVGVDGDAGVTVEGAGVAGGSVDARTVGAAVGVASTDGRTATAVAEFVGRAVGAEGAHAPTISRNTRTA